MGIVNESSDTKRKVQDPQPLTNDPVYYVMVGLFALLTSAFSIMLTQTRFLPILQSLFLTLFIAIPLRKGLWRRALRVSFLWFVIAFALVATMTVLAASTVEASLPNGFIVRTDTLAWVYGAAGYPEWLLGPPLTVIVKLLGLIIGSIASAGLIGNWLFVQMINQVAFSFAIAWQATGSIVGLPLAIPWWDLLQIIGLGGFVILFSQPILTGQWSPRHYWTEQRALVVGSFVALTLGVVFSVAGARLWQVILSTMINNA